jgi:concanavalin A-like lectin/glucanase superfamily protein
MDHFRDWAELVSIHQALFATNSFTVDSAQFDGTNDCAKRGGGLTGAADGKQLTFSCWFRLDGGDGAELSILAGARSVGSATTDFEVFRDTGNTLSIGGNAPGGGATQLFLSSTGTYVAGASWHHLLMSMDMANAAGSFIYVDDANNTPGSGIFFNGNLDFTLADWIIGAIGDSSLKFNGCLAELWFNTSWMDISNSANRRKFRSAAGKPVYLGANGQLPLGTTPLIYQHLLRGASADSFATNRGTGGGFTVTGALTTGSTAP